MKSILGLVLLVAALALNGCARRAPVPPADGTPTAASLAIPLDVQAFEVAQADGHHGVFLKLSRLPDAVEHHSEHAPARIVIDIKGPTGGDSPEEVFPGRDQLVYRLRVARTLGVLRVILDLAGDRTPGYSVHTMADWIMVRIAGDESSAIEPWPGPFTVAAYASD